MANLTIFSNTTSGLSWSATSVDTSETTNEDTVVTNSSGATVYWTEGGSNGSITNSGQLTCLQGAVKKKWNFANTSGGTAQVTLTITASGGGAPPPGLQSEGHPSNKGKKD